MLKLLIASVVTALALSACGGGGDNAAAPTPVLKLSFSGAPIAGSAAAAVTKAAVIHAATDDPASAATVSNLTSALTAAGVTANVSVQTLDGTALHALIIGTDNGASPPASAYTTNNPTSWNIVNFKLADMVTTMDDPAQQASAKQFQQDITVFIQRGYVAGMQTFTVTPIPTCDASTGLTASDGLAGAIAQAGALAYPVGTIQASEAAGHMGTDCRTPDAYILDLQTKRIASDIATRWNLYLHPLCAASNNQAGCVASQ